MQKTLTDFRNSQPIRVEDVQAIVRQVIEEVAAFSGARIGLTGIDIKSQGFIKCEGLDLSWDPGRPIGNALHIKLAIQRGNIKRNQIPRGVILDISVAEDVEKTNMKVGVGTNEVECPTGVHQSQWLLDILRNHIISMFQDQEN